MGKTQTQETRELLAMELAMHKDNMCMANSEDTAFDEYCYACDIRQILFPGKCGMQDCAKCYLTRQYNDICREIRQRPANVVININNSNVTINNR